MKEQEQDNVDRAGTVGVSLMWCEFNACPVGPAVMSACVSVHLQTACELILNVRSAIVSFTSFWKILAITTSEFHDQGPILIGPADNDRTGCEVCPPVLTQACLLMGPSAAGLQNGFQGSQG